MSIVITDEYLDLANEIVPHTNAVGAYCVGLVSALAWENGLEPTRFVLEAAADCGTITQALEMFDSWQKLQVANRRASAPAALPDTSTVSTGVDQNMKKSEGLDHHGSGQGRC